MEEIKTIFEDEREIQSIEWENDGSIVSIDGPYSVEKIVAYKEHGPLGWVPFLAVYKKGVITSRVSALGVIIAYKNPK